MTSVRSKRKQNAFIIALITLLTLISSFFPISPRIASASETEPTIEIETSYIEPGETDVITINAENIPTPGLVGYQLNLVYDQQVIEVLGVEKSSSIPFGFQIANSDNPGVVRLVAIRMDGSGVTGDFALSHIKIRSKQEAKGSTELKLEGLQLAMANTESLDAEVVNGILEFNTETPYENPNKNPNETPEEHQNELTMNLLSLPPAVLNQPYSVKLGANNGKPPYKWSSTELPAGLKLDQQTGEISGIPTADTKTYLVVVTVTDSSLPAQSVSIEIPIEVAAMLKAPQSPNNEVGIGTGVGRGNNNGPLFVRAGDDRYQTALAIALAHFPQLGPKNILVANGYASADALAGAPLAFKLKAPIILSSTDPSVTTELNDYIMKTRAHGGNIVLLGGTGVINSTYSNAYTSMQKQRIGGVNRRETAVLIARELLGETTGKPVVVVNENAFVDAISIAPFAAKEGWPILLTSKDELSAETSDYLDELKPSSILVIGSTGVVSEKVYKDLSNKTNTGVIARLGGLDRFETNAQVLEWAQNMHPDQFTPGKANLAFANGDADDVIDALAGAALGIPIVLVHNKNELNASQQGFLQQLGTVTSEILGSSGVIDPVLKW